RVLSVGAEEIKLAVRGGSVSVTGVGLMIAEIGGGDVYIKGEIAAVTAE
ncbi:MAG TPA: YabP/YqfC family sporulation protein, partial [Candidatus Limadaptatus stercoripullorum]|nr:YabP/YqfC family sporulation protein [Candidatus Limadaptatus stercoripullorum]